MEYLGENLNKGYKSFGLSVFLTEHASYVRSFHSVHMAPVRQTLWRRLVEVEMDGYIRLALGINHSHSAHLISV